MKEKYAIIYYEGKPSNYGITKKGNVFNLKTNHVMKQRLNINGYFFVRLSFTKNHRTEVLVHRLIATYFISNPENKPEVHHIDKNKLNNNIKNLMWVTNEEHKKLHENDNNHPFSKGEKHSNSILTDNEVHQICLYIENNQYSQHELAVLFNVQEQVIHEIKLKHNWTYISDLYDFSNYTKYDWSSTDINIVRNICEDIVSNNFTAKEIANKYNVKIDVVQRIRRGESFKDIISEYDFSKNTTIRINNMTLSKDILDLMKQGKSNLEIREILKLPKGQKTNRTLCDLRKKYKL